MSMRSLQHLCWVLLPGFPLLGWAIQLCERLWETMPICRLYCHTCHMPHDSIRFDMFNVLGGNWDPCKYNFSA
jgi:hypothetical protein